jgi:hypothetical protein
MQKLALTTAFPVTLFLCLNRKPVLMRHSLLIPQEAPVLCSWMRVYPEFIDKYHSQIHGLDGSQLNITKYQLIFRPFLVSTFKRNIVD